MMLKCTDSAITLFATAETKRYTFGEVTVAIDFGAKRRVVLTQCKMPVLKNLTAKLGECTSTNKVSPAALNSIKQAQMLHGGALTKDSFSNECLRCMAKFPESMITRKECDQHAVVKTVHVLCKGCIPLFSCTFKID